MRLRSSKRHAGEPDQQQRQELHEAATHEADAREVGAQEAGPQEAGSVEAALEGGNELSHYTGASKRSKKHAYGSKTKGKFERYQYHCLVCQSSNKYSRIGDHFNVFGHDRESWK